MFQRKGKMPRPEADPGDAEAAQDAPSELESMLALLTITSEQYEEMAGPVRELVKRVDPLLKVVAGDAALAVGLLIDTGLELYTKLGPKLNEVAVLKAQRARVQWNAYVKAGFSKAEATELLVADRSSAGILQAVLQNVKINRIVQRD